jgi:hypothetical protein
MAPSGNATNVIWTMEGAQPYLGKVMGVVMNMDKMIGNDFEKGLSNLKAISEK